MQLSFSPHPDFNWRVDVIGQDRAPVLVVDNFVNSPERLVDAAGRAFSAHSRTRSHFPGRLASVPEPYAISALNFLLPLISRTFGVSGEVKNGSCDFQVLTTPPDRLSPQQCIPHYDTQDINVVASVHYLCRPGFLGTNFYKHRSSGFELITPARLKAYENAISREIVDHPPEGYITDDTPIFSKIAGYEAVFNRIILFSGTCLHSGAAHASHGFDSRPDHGRLTANMFLKFSK